MIYLNRYFKYLNYSLSKYLITNYISFIFVKENTNYKIPKVIKYAFHLHVISTIHVININTAHLCIYIYI